MAADVLEAMMPYFSGKFGNASSSTHAYGWAAAEAVKVSREKIANYFGVSAEEVFFTSGATEGINWVLKGIYDRYQQKGKHIITSRIEHSAVLDTVKHLERMGAEVSYVGVNSQGIVNRDELTRLIRPDTILVSIMWANNETGVIQPVNEISKICQEAGVFFFSDATQAVGKCETPLGENGPDLLTFSGHKLYGPKGIGAVIVRKKRPAIRITPLIDGGGQEQGMRGGTLNVPGIVGLARAVERIDSGKWQTWQQMRDDMEKIIIDRLPEVMVVGDGVLRLPGVSNLIIPGVNTSRLISALSSKVALSSGSACTSGSLEPSHVLVAMGISDQYLQSALRICLNEMMSKSELQIALKLIVNACDTLRKLA